jgi:hypothetical protein
MHSRRVLPFVIAVTAALTPASSLHAQIWDRITNPGFDLEIVHPPQVILKGVTKLGVLQFGGDQRCAPELTARLTQLFMRNGKFEVVDRENINRILQEQGFQASGAVSGDAAVKLGHLVGPAAIINGRITRCSVERSGLLRDPTAAYKDKNGVVHTKYSRTVTAHMTSSVSLIDLTTGKIYAGDLLDISESAENSAYDGEPEPPKDDDAMTKMYESAVGRVVPMLFETKSKVRVVVFDDDKCDLKRSAAQIKRGDVAAALTTLQASTEGKCGGSSDKNLLSKAQHNYGVALISAGRADDGLISLNAASDLRNTGITNDAIVVARKVIAENENRRLKEVSAISLGAAAAVEASNIPVGMTNKDVLSLAKGKLSDAVIVAKIKSSTCRFDVTTDGLIALKQGGVSDVVILAMTDAASSKCK